MLSTVRKIKKDMHLHVPTMALRNFGVHEGDEVEFQITSQGILITPANETPLSISVTEKGRAACNSFWSPSY
ncbi:AbrB/MazE/SpoVT family DNA-binding domain-containing protein [Clostridiaceae bacterium NSJ-31]|uniref:AbrB/MazE/SpoVT family DNA-binding domain-containing protein n=1 Tax=Ligaoa zhengdingensis TaxID=2763658 RepID=A0A926E098_9FIRM|nr:AbrB/MazE/SpoVT family DNA-binding domain-containing protein [Ligaoa zhengdingensis]MBC8546450.1 AbrB/MazE/SpoVT family DNA-binding domain-containing protein [Ligaoa zhengdingensis]